MSTAVQQGGLNQFTIPLKSLAAFDESIKNDKQNGIPFRFADYLALVDWTGRAVREDKRGFIPEQLPPTLSRLSIEPEIWLANTTQFEARYRQQFSHSRKRTACDTG